MLSPTRPAEETAHATARTASPAKAIRRARAALAITALTVLTALGLNACSPKQAAFNSMDVTGAPWGQSYSLPDLNGKPVTEKSFSGKVTAVFFGFLYCPDACPAHLTKMKAVKEQLGEKGNDLQVVFITVDPERDQPESLKRFLASFDPTFVGLRGSTDQVAAIAKDFRVYFKKVETSAAKQDPMSYTIDHTTFAYIYDKKGALRLVVPHDLAIEKLTADIQSLM